MWDLQCGIVYCHFETGIYMCNWWNSIGDTKNNMFFDIFHVLAFFFRGNQKSVFIKFRLKFTIPFLTSVD